ncbi:hypothetical protein PR048_014660 [Dryococelus australis]|uniref:Uncharacterized protein n=1 Tax=Dryococelus australis TaxID=614101 RepID=A0ABQ9HFA1_9NEOP|nr:hypothetical protein PR048_014660 [Dryococelus australis]
MTNWKSRSKELCDALLGGYTSLKAEKKDEGLTALRPPNRRGKGITSSQRKEAKINATVGQILSPNLAHPHILAPSIKEVLRPSSSKTKRHSRSRLLLTARPVIESENLPKPPPAYGVNHCQRESNPMIGHQREPHGGANRSSRASCIQFKSYKFCKGRNNFMDETDLTLVADICGFINHPEVPCAIVNTLCKMFRNLVVMVDLHERLTPTGKMFNYWSLALHSARHGQGKRLNRVAKTLSGQGGQRFGNSDECELLCASVVKVYREWTNRTIGSYRHGNCGAPSVIDVRGERRLRRCVKANRKATVEQLPDLNPIEQLWDHLDRRGALQTVWLQIPVETYKSLPDRLTAVRAAKGGLSFSQLGATVAERLARSPPTKANRVQSPAGSPDFRKWESCRTMPLVGRFSRGSPVSPTPSFRCCSIFTSITLIGFHNLATKNASLVFLRQYTGGVPSRLSKCESWKMIHSRWLTTADRILRLYLSTAEPPGWYNPLEPLATLNISDEGIKSLIISGAHFEIGKLLSHSQVGERHVRLVIEASLATHGAEARDGFIRIRIKFRNELPKLNIMMIFFGPRVEPEDDKRNTSPLKSGRKDRDVSSGTGCKSRRTGNGWGCSGKEISFLSLSRSRSTTLRPNFSSLPVVPLYRLNYNKFPRLVDSPHLHLICSGARQRGELTCSLGFTPREFRLPEQCHWSAGFLGDLPFPPQLQCGTAPYSPHFTLIGSEYLNVKSSLNPFTHHLVVKVTAWLKEFCTSEAYKHGSVRGDRDMRINSLTASTNEALIWRAVLPSITHLYENSSCDPTNL